MKVALVIFFIIFFLGLAGGHYKPQLPLSGEKIAIPLFVNETFKEDIEEIVTQEVINQFMLRTALQIVSESKARYIIKGKILRYIKEPTLVNTTGGDYKITIEIVATFFSCKPEKKLWEEEVSRGVVCPSFETEREMVKKISRDIGEELVNLTLERLKR